jgi:hypothetical protein
MTPDLAALVPITKFDTEKASALVHLGYPTIEPVIPKLLEWMQDLNWPVAHVFQPFLASIGQPIAPNVRVVLSGEDSGWKYSLLSAVVSCSPELARALRPELERLARHPTTEDSNEEVDLVATEILGAIGGATEA